MNLQEIEEKGKKLMDRFEERIKIYETNFREQRECSEMYERLMQTYSGSESERRLQLMSTSIGKDLIARWRQKESDTQVAKYNVSLASQELDFFTSTVKWMANAGIVE